MLDNVSVFMFNKSVLFMSIRTRDVMDNVIGSEVPSKRVIFATSIRLHNFDVVA